MIVRMKRRILAALPLCLAASALILTSCETTQDRISKHPEIYQRLSANNQALVSQGQIRAGMSRNAVWLQDARFEASCPGKSVEAQVGAMAPSIRTIAWPA